MYMHEVYTDKGWSEKVRYKCPEKTSIPRDSLVNEDQSKTKIEIPPVPIMEIITV